MPGGRQASAGSGLPVSAITATVATANPLATLSEPTDISFRARPALRDAGDETGRLGTACPAP